MISVPEATAVITAHTRNFGVEETDLQKAAGRILREPLFADRDFPPFSRVAMDGIAIAYDSYREGRRRFAIEGTLGAGAPPSQLRDPIGCLEVMTGAVLPAGADTVVRYEDLDIADDTALIRTDGVREGQNIQSKGLERRQGQQLVAAGTRLSPAEIGIAATVGKSRLTVAATPHTLIIYTGDELVGVDALPLPHQIRVSNGPTITAALQEYAIQADTLHLRDEEPVVRQTLRDTLEKYDLLLLSGGISKGKFDYIPGVLDQLGVRQLIYRVAQRPAKAFWFGNLPGGATVFALPGNPVSAFLCTLRYVMPWLEQSLEQQPPLTSFVRLSEAVHYPKDRTYFLQVKLRMDPDGIRRAVPVRAKGSGDLASLADSDGFVELPAGAVTFGTDEGFRYLGYRNYR